MNCADIRPLLHAYADGELDAANTLELERHIKTCAQCAAEQKSLSALKSALREPALLYRAPDSLRKNVRQLVAAPAPARERDERPRETGIPWFWKYIAFGTTAFALITLLLRPAGISGREQFLDEAVASHVRSLMVEHLTDVVSSDQHTVKPWFDGKIDFAPDVKDFAADGFTLLGGRLDYLQGRSVAALVYRHNKHLINVFIWPATADQSSITETRRGYTLITATAHNLNYCLVSDLNAKELGDLATLCEK